MKYAHTPLVVGNWKMNPTTVAAAQRLFKDVHKGLARTRGVEVVVAPPALYAGILSGFAYKIPALAVQDVYWERLGPHTGETSPAMLKDTGIKYAIVGHSERRALGENDERVNKKVLALLKDGITPIVCVGEKKRDHSAHYLNIVEDQVRTDLSGVTKTKLAQVVIAYEPIWAISHGDGHGQTATADDAHEMKLFIQKILVSMFGRTAAMKVRIIYGGSANISNVEDLYVHGMVDGFLPGGASLRSGEFIEMVKTIERLHAKRHS